MDISTFVKLSRAYVRRMRQLAFLAPILNVAKIVAIGLPKRTADLIEGFQTTPMVSNKIFGLFALRLLMVGVLR